MPAGDPFTWFLFGVVMLFVLRREEEPRTFYVLPEEMRMLAEEAPHCLVCPDK